MIRRDGVKYPLISGEQMSNFMGNREANTLLGSSEHNDLILIYGGGGYGNMPIYFRKHVTPSEESIVFH